MGSDFWILSRICGYGSCLVSEMRIRFGQAGIKATFKALFSPEKNHSMTNALILDLLDELSKRVGPVDWRRSHAHPQVESWTQRLSALKGAVSEEHYLHAQALLAKANIDSVGMVDALCALARRSQRHVGFVRKEIWSIFHKWEFVDWYSNQEEKWAILDRFEENLTALLNTYSGDRIFIFALSIVVREKRGVLEALDLLEREAVAGAKVADLYLNMLMKNWAKRSNPEIIARAIVVSPIIEDCGEEVWYPFIIQRAFMLASLIHYHGMNVKILPFEPRLLRITSDFNGALVKTLSALDELKPISAAKILLTISKIRCFWRSPVPGAEDARQRAIEYTFGKIRASGDEKERELLFRALFFMTPQTKRFWTDKQWRISSSKSVTTQCTDIKEPYLSLIRSRFFFTQEDYPAAKKYFADLARFAPNKNGPSTYVDPLSVGAKLSSPIIGSEIPRRASFFELVNDIDGGQEPIVISSANDRYFLRYGESYVRRLATFSPVGHLHFHLFADPDLMKAEVYRLKALIPNFRFTWSCEPVTVNEPYFFATGRFLRVREWMERFNAPIIVTDIDSFWDRTETDRPSDFIINRLGASDVALNLRTRIHIRTMAGMPVPGLYFPSAEPWTAVLAGVMALGVTEGARQFADMLALLTHHELSVASTRTSRGNWGIDQNILCAAYAYTVKNYPSIKFADISATKEGWGQHWLAERD